MDRSERIYNGHIYILDDDYLIIDNIKYELPKKSRSNNITMINNKIYVNGYEFKNGKFKRTLKSIWYKFF